MAPFTCGAMGVCGDLENKRPRPDHNGQAAVGLVKRHCAFAGSSHAAFIPLVGLAAIACKTIEQILPEWLTAKLTRDIVDHFAQSVADGSGRGPADPIANKPEDRAQGDALELVQLGLELRYEPAFSLRPRRSGRTDMRRRRPFRTIRRWWRRHREKWPTARFYLRHATGGLSLGPSIVPPVNPAATDAPNAAQG